MSKENVLQVILVFLLLSIGYFGTISLYPASSQIKEGIRSSYSLEELVDSAKQHETPVDLKQYLLDMSGYQGDLKKCREEKRLSISNLPDFFSAIPIKIVDSKMTFLAFPSIFECGELFGAHKIPYWVVLRQTDGNFRIIHLGVTDELFVTQNEHSNYASLVEHHQQWDEGERFDFVGQKYQYAGVIMLSKGGVEIKVASPRQ